MKKRESYYLGLDIGTDSVGYAVTNQNYDLLKFKGEPMWGTHLFEGGQDTADRRLHRTSRRRIDRRQQRVSLINELFAEEIVKVDPHFFQRRRESSLYGDDSLYGVRLFGADTGLSDREYHEKYPTIHHLILELMTSDVPHDIRLVYIACAWLVAHRGHFLFDIAPDRMDKLLDFDAVYSDFCQYLLDQNYTLPWDGSVSAEDILNIIKMDVGVARKKDAFKTRLYNGKKISKEYAEDFPYSREAIVTLLSGGSVKPGLLFDNETYGEVESVSLQMGDEDFDRIVSELGDDGELLLKLRSMHNCVRLIATMSQKREQDPVCVSSSKVAIYEQHREDLKLLKRIVKRYCPQNYDEIFRSAQAGNYVSYTRNAKSCPDPDKVKGASKDVFCDYLKKKLKNLKVSAADKKPYESMMERLETSSFLPKQKDTDNRVIPQQLYRQELNEILRRAENDLPYNVQAKKLFTAAHRHGDLVYWDGEKDLAKVRKTVGKNAVHLTRYAFCRKGGLFDQQPVKKAPGLIPLKNGLPTERYGGYNKPTASCYVLARFMLDGKSEIMLVPVELHVRDAVLSDGNRLLKYVETTVENILGKYPQDTQLLLKGRILKINTVISLDGTMMTLAGKSSGGKNILLSPVAPLILPAEWEKYAKCLESFRKKTETNKNLEPDEIHDGISQEKNMAFYQLLTEKMNAWPFVNYPGNQGQTLVQGIEKFTAEQTKAQIICLLNILALMGSGASGVDLSVCGGSKKAGTKVINAKLSNWKKRYQEVYIVDVSASGLFRKTGCNLLELL